MAEDAQGDKVVQAPPKSKVPMIVSAFVVVAALAAVGMVMMMRGDSDGPREDPTAEFIVKEKMYQLKDGSYLKLGFSVVIAKRHVERVRTIVEQDMPGRLPDGINMVLGDKTRQELIAGTHKRETFARELKKMLEERVFHEYNKKQTTPSELIEVKEVLISHYVTQPG